jgi:hypothetical protein
VRLSEYLFVLVPSPAVLLVRKFLVSMSLACRRRDQSSGGVGKTRPSYRKLLSRVNRRQGGNYGNDGGGSHDKHGEKGKACTHFERL